MARNKPNSPRFLSTQPDLPASPFLRLPSVDTQSYHLPHPPHNAHLIAVATTESTDRQGRYDTIDVMTMAADVDANALHDMFDDHPSLSASLEDFEHNATLSESRPPLMHIPSHHSGFYRADDADSDAQSDSGSAFFPPGERRFGSASANLGWSTHRPYHQEPLLRSALSASRVSLKRSREESPQYDSAPEPDAIVATVAPEPKPPTDSPRMQSHRPSPDVYPESNADIVNTDFGKTFRESVTAPTGAPATENHNNCATRPHTASWAAFERSQG